MGAGGPLVVIADDIEVLAAGIVGSALQNAASIAASSLRVKPRVSHGLSNASVRPISSLLRWRHSTTDQPSPLPSSAK
jgi:hypothetical protein